MNSCGSGPKAPVASDEEPELVSGEPVSRNPVQQESSSKELKAKVLPRGMADRQMESAMYRLYARHYADSSASTFKRDLLTKTHVLLLVDADEQLCGFSTIELHEARTPVGAIADDADGKLVQLAASSIGYECS